MKIKIKEPFHVWWEDKTRTRAKLLSDRDKVGQTIREGWDFVNKDCHKTHRLLDMEKSMMGAFGAIACYTNFEDRVDWENCQNIAGLIHASLQVHREVLTLPDIDFYISRLNKIYQLIIKGGSEKKVSMEISNIATQAMMKFYTDTGEITFKDNQGQDISEKMVEAFEK